MILFPNDFLKGTVEITDNLMYIKERIYQQPIDVRVAVLSEEDLLSARHPNVIKAANLLPPVEAQIAEVDGLADKYYAIYTDHLGNDPFNVEFISAFITFIHRGGSLIFLCQDVNAFFAKAFVQLIMNIYGIGIPIYGTGILPVYNYAYLPKWLLSMYSYNTIDAVEFCANFPLEADLPMPVIDKLVMDLGIYADSYGKSISAFRRYHKMIRKNPLVQNALVSSVAEDSKFFNMI